MNQYEHRECPEAIEKHKDAHARSLGSWIMACAEGWCGCGKDCGRDACDICPTEDGPA